MKKLDLRIVSTSHSEITIALSGLALTILLLTYPLFVAWSPESIVDPKLLGTSLTFFFFSLTFGLLASYEFSVISGDLREQNDLMIVWTFPTLSFAISIMTLFAGFVYMIESYAFIGVHRDSNAFSLMRLISTIAIFAGVFFLVRTNFEANLLLKEPQEQTASKFDSFNTLTFLVIITICLLAVIGIRMVGRLAFIFEQIDSLFYLLVGALLYCIVGYGFTDVWGFSIRRRSTTLFFIASALALVLALWISLLLP